jgi:hypothetical protein
MAINNVCQNIACWREFHADRWEPYCSSECRQVQNARLTVPYSIPAPAGSEIRRPARPTQQIPGRADLEADRKAAGPTPKERAHAALRAGRAALAVPPPASRTMSVREAEAAMSIERTAAATRRLHAQQEDDMMAKLGLAGRATGMERRDLTAY